MEKVPHDLRVLLNELSTRQNTTENLSGRIVLLERAIELTSRTKAPQVWVSLHGMLGDDLMRTTVGDHADNVDRAILAYEEAASLLSKTEQPLILAITLNGLASAYLARSRGKSQKNIERAVGAYIGSLEAFSFVDEVENIEGLNDEDLFVTMSTMSNEHLRKVFDQMRSVLLAWL